MKPVNLTIRIDDDLKKQFIQAAAGNNRNASILLRDFIIEYVKKNAQQTLKGM